ncbi:single-stranded DNA-binding protein [Candidatus Parabeggiatoa sp. HSG14]|uniref:single-stranded DNA-binding protein n=1 Tax=Candidatus Parabeggiatoa sp. HSG14 TaxID=3055593 RepID=UPI0025A81C8F|nr:single-stranded DNA-binding protein [Thiotrichales bacterium HSG14]
MFQGVNKAIFVGNLGNEPDMRQTHTGSAIANISLATSYRTKDQQTGEWRDETEWVRVVFFDRQAEIVGQYLHKGSQVYVEGSLRTEKWQDKNTGQDRYTTKIYATEVQMLGSRADNTGGYSTPYATNQGGGQPISPSVEQSTTSSASMNPNMEQSSSPQSLPKTESTPQNKNFDEDVPF